MTDAVRDLEKVVLSDHHVEKLIEGKEEDERFSLGRRFYGVPVNGFCDVCNRRGNPDA